MPRTAEGPESCSGSVWNGKNQLLGAESARLCWKTPGAGQPAPLRLLGTHLSCGTANRCCLCLPRRTDAPGPGSTAHYRNWNPPLLGNLPEDFLRILPQQTAGTQGSHSCRQPVPRGLGSRGQGSLEQERRWKQYLEDERIALFLQNEEFMKELQRNRDFLLALERDRLKYESKKSKSTSVAVSNDFGFSSVLSGDVAPSATSEAGGAVSDDALFRDKLKHMGKSTRKKLFELARAFSEKTKMRKSKRKHLLKHQVMGTAASTANLLDDVEGHAYDEDFQARRQQQLREEEETPKAGQ
ncbi:CUE domain-containing protein 1 [Cyanistes caeruleus]|uniref:CUE domain-containing protein 1 n=1 Tax=Cyanistes caeruleus TaxID=156563 RepID=UPI000CDAC907|nr:CUE domain-containing protein 1 [Cyanistes caeruleus]